MPGMLNALTFDVEDYYHVASFEGCVRREEWHLFPSRVVASTGKILAALDQAGVQGTFFILGWVAEQHPELVRTIQAAGHEIGCHSYWHRLVYRQRPEEFRADLCRARDVLEQITGEAVTAYRAPCFSITRRSLWALDILIEEGFGLDSSIFPTFHDRYGIAGAPAAPHWIRRPAGNIREFPLSVYSWWGYPLPVAGGGYFRLFPYAWTRHCLRAINAAGRPAAFYLHPWEVDPEQPRLAAGWFNTFRHYLNLHTMERRLARLLEDFSFGTVSEAFAQADTGEVATTWDLRPAA